LPMAFIQKPNWIIIKINFNYNLKFYYNVY
jgi:hypothetical protein